MKYKYKFLGLIISSLLLCHGALAQGEKPNIVFIMADDIGMGDISTYGAKLINTPNIDKLADQGRQFERYYTAGAVCAPTRYSVITGRYPFRTKELEDGINPAHDYLFVDQDRETIGTLMQKMGYKTAAIGKWHLGYGVGKKINWNGTLTPGPNDVGFDYHWGVPRNHSDNFRCYIENDKIYGLDPNSKYKMASGDRRVQGLLEERVDDQVDSTLTAKVLDFIRENKEEPFFVYFTPVAAHTHVTPNARFRGTSKAGQYGDYVQELDYHVGEVMALIKELNLEDNTIFIFASDNGGQLKDTNKAGLGLKLADESGDVALKAKTAKIDARAMGHKTNLDWREGKASPYEGGFRVPLIIRWPGKIASGSTSSKLLNSSDFLATFADFFEQELPEGSGEDSFSFLDELNGDKVTRPRTSVALHSSEARSFVDGEWKLIDFSYSLKSKNEYELYNLTEDPSESNNLAALNPRKLDEMREKLKQIVDAGRSR